MSAWFRGPLADWARETIMGTSALLDEWFDQTILSSILDEHQAGRVDHGKRIYALVMLAKWISES